MKMKKENSVENRAERQQIGRILDVRKGGKKKKGRERELETVIKSKRKDKDRE